MPISMKATLFAFFISLALFLTPETGRCAGPGTKIVTRIDTVTAVMKGGTLTVRVEGMASTPSLLGRGGELLKRGQAPNKDGLLEYELVFNPPQKNYTGDALKLVKTTIKVSPVPAGVKGVRIYAEYNELNGMLPEPKQEPASKKKEPFLKPEEPVVAKKEKPVAKKEEVAAKKEEKEKTRQWWNPFHHKPATPQVNAPPPAVKKQALALKKKEPVVKKEEPIVAKKEKPTLKQEELAPKKPEVVLKKEEKPKHGWNLNPFHRKPAASPVTAPPPTEAPVLKKKEAVVKKEELVVTKKEKPVAKNEEVAPKIEEKKKKSRGWNLNPFHRKPAASPTTAMPPEPKKPEPELKKKELVVKKEESAATKKENPISKKEESASKKKEPAVTKEKPAPKKEEAPPPKKEEKKKKSRLWNLNPFHRKPDASQSNDEAPR
jgi:hypothetical protein